MTRDEALKAYEYARMAAIEKQTNAVIKARNHHRAQVELNEAERALQGARRELADAAAKLHPLIDSDTLDICGGKVPTTAERVAASLKATIQHAPGCIDEGSSAHGVGCRTSSESSP